MESEVGPLVGPLVAFSGSRTFDDQALVEKVMRRLVRRYGPRMRVRVGDARGLDFIAGKEATRWGIWPDQQICHWPPPGATRQERWMAAHERNERVVQGANLLIAFFSPGKRSPGTSDAIKIAQEHGIPVHVYHEGGWSQE